MTATPAPSPAVRTPDPQWLSEVLGVPLSGMESRVIGNDRGFISTTWQLRLHTDPPGLVPECLVLKSESGNRLFQALGRERHAFEREIHFYRELAPLLEMRLPHIHGAGTAEDPWLLMEDLSHLRAGDQVRGLSQSEVRSVVRSIAALHARFWQDSTLERFDWLPEHRYFFSEPDLSLLPVFLEEYGLRIGDTMEAVLPLALQQQAQIDAVIAQRPCTLVHGDLRADNLLFGGDGDHPVTTIIDWASACRSLGAIDLAYLIGGSEPPQERSGHLDELFYLWHGELLAHGVKNYPLTEARHDLRLAALRCLAVSLRMYGTLHHPSTTVRGALFRDASIARHVQLAQELRAWEALPDGLSPC